MAETRRTIETVHVERISTVLGPDGMPSALLVWTPDGAVYELVGEPLGFLLGSGRRPRAASELPPLGLNGGRGGNEPGLPAIPIPRPNPWDKGVKPGLLPVDKRKIPQLGRSPQQCPECGKTLSGRAGLGSHRYHSHGIEGISRTAVKNLGKTTGKEA